MLRKLAAVSFLTFAMLVSAEAQMQLYGPVTNGFPITLGTTVITGNSTVTSVTGLSIAAGGSNTLAATSFAGNGCTLGTDNLCVTGTTSVGNVNVTGTTIPVTGIYNSGGGILRIATSTTLQWSIGAGGTFLSKNANGLELLDTAGSCTAPNFLPNVTAATTGYSGDGTKLCAAIAGTEKLDVTTNGALDTGYLQAGSVTAYTGLQAGDIAMTYHSDVATAPGANGCYLAWVPATVTGHKLIARCNTSTTAVTIVDNVGN